MTPATPTTPPPAKRVRPKRPVLAREADSTYWMARYVERTENVARILLSSTECVIDVRDVAPAFLDRQWRSVLRIMHVDDPQCAELGGVALADRVAQIMTFSEENPNSLASCLTRARENARGIREGISSEMWEHLNQLYWSIRSDEARARFQESPHELYNDIISGAMTFHGLTDQTLWHGERWHFAQAGRYFERITCTCRILSELMPSRNEGGPDAPLRNIQWTTILKSCNSLEANRRANPGELDPESIISFLLLAPSFPRSVLFSVTEAKNAVGAISAEVNPRGIDPAELILGRLHAQLKYADPEELLATSLNNLLSQIVHQTAQAAMAVQKSYFLH